MSVGQRKKIRVKFKRVFLSYAGEDSAEASMLQCALEAKLKDLEISVWTYGRDQAKSERQVASSLPQRIRESFATILLVSPATIKDGATQWMELAYADAFKKPTFILLHHLTYDELKNSEKDVPVLVLEGQCNPASEWHLIEPDLRDIFQGDYHA